MLIFRPVLPQDRMSGTIATDDGVYHMCCVLTVLLTLGGLGLACVLGLLYLLWPGKDTSGRDWLGAGYD
jgi:hypothetical protein